MGLAYYIVLESPPPDFDPHVSGKAVARALERLDAAAAEAGVPSLQSFLSIAAEDVAALDGDAEEAPGELVAKLGLARDPGFLYYVEKGDVMRVARKRPGRPAAAPEKVAALGVPQEEGWVYALNEEGDVVRHSKNPPALPGRQWFDADAGLATVQALRARVTDDPAVARDLADFEEVLGEASRRRLRFYLMIDF
jgi:hypothetical protein